MLGKRKTIDEISGIEPKGWACAAICNIACKNTAKALCKNSTNNTSIIKQYHMTHLGSSSD